MAPRDLWTIGLIIITLLAVAFLLQRTKIGKAMRAVSDNRDLAASSGIDVDRVILFVWALGGGAGRHGRRPVRPQRADLVQQRLQPAAADVRRHHPRRAGHGLRRAGRVVRRRHVHPDLDALWVSPELKNVGALVVLILVLLVRPQGILGQKERVG